MAQAKVKREKHHVCKCPKNYKLQGRYHNLFKYIIYRNKIQSRKPTTLMIDLAWFIIPARESELLSAISVPEPPYYISLCTSPPLEWQKIEQWGDPTHQALDPRDPPVVNQGDPQESITKPNKRQHVDPFRFAGHGVVPHFLSIVWYPTNTKHKMERSYIALNFSSY